MLKISDIVSKQVLWVFEILYSFAEVYKFYSCGVIFSASRSLENPKTQEILYFETPCKKLSFVKLTPRVGYLSFVGLIH